MLLSVDSFVQSNRGFGVPSASAKQDTLRLDDKDDGLDFVGNALNIFWNGCCFGAGFLKMFN